MQRLSLPLHREGTEHTPQLHESNLESLGYLSEEDICISVSCTDLQRLANPSWYWPRSRGARGKKVLWSLICIPGSLGTYVNIETSVRSSGEVWKLEPGQGSTEWERERGNGVVGWDGRVSRGLRGCREGGRAWAFLKMLRQRGWPAGVRKLSSKKCTAGVRAAGSSPNIRKMLQPIVLWDLIFSSCRILIFQCMYF